MSAFILLYIFIPYINKAINSLGRKEHLKLICISLFIFYILRMLSGQHFYGNELVQLMVIYTIGAFFGKYKGDILSNKKLNIVVFIITSILLLGGTIVFDLLKNEYLDPVYLYDRASIFALLFSVSLFNIFACKKEFSSKFINTVSSCVLGVYLISEQPNLRKLLWKKWFVVSNYVDKPYMILYMIGIVLAIFIVCIIIDYIRKNSIERFGLFVYDKIDKYWEKRHEKNNIKKN